MGQEFQKGFTGCFQVRVSRVITSICWLELKKQGEGHKKSGGLARHLFSGFSEPLHVIFPHRVVWASSRHTGLRTVRDYTRGWMLNATKVRILNPKLWSCLWWPSPGSHTASVLSLSHTASSFKGRRQRTPHPPANVRVSSVVRRGHGKEAAVLTILGNTISHSRSFWAFCLIKCCPWGVGD